MQSRVFWKDFAMKLPHHDMKGFKVSPPLSGLFYVLKGRKEKSLHFCRLSKSWITGGSFRFLFQASHCRDGFAKCLFYLVLSYRCPS